MYTVAAAGVPSKASPRPSRSCILHTQEQPVTNTWLRHKRNIQGDATTRERGQDHKDETRQQQTQARQRETGTQSDQRATTLCGRVNRYLTIGSRGLNHGKSLQTTFHRRLQQRNWPRRLEPRGTTKNHQQDRIGNDNHRSDTPSSCEIRMNFTHLSQNGYLEPKWLLVVVVSECVFNVCMSTT